MNRPLNLNLDYLKTCISEGRDVLVPGIGVVTKVSDLPSQDELDKQLPKGYAGNAVTAGTTPVTEGTRTADSGKSDKKPDPKK